MDGGRSSTLAWWNPEIDGNDKTELINRPVGTGDKLLTPETDLSEFSERANGNNKGLWIQSP